jgi:uncharacterized protein (TIGR01244 family)
MRTRVKMVLSLAAAALATAVFASVGVESIDKFHRVDARVAIGGQPTPEQVRALADAGYAGILNLREDAEENDAFHARAARESGLQFFRVPVSKTNPTDQSVAKFLKVTDDETLYPVYIFCAEGNRAAAFWMIRRVLRDGWKLESAEKEAAAAGLASEPMRDFARGYIARHPRTPGGTH